MKNPPLLLRESRPIKEVGWEMANKDILWCWKRDQGRLRRSILFSGKLTRVSNHKFQLDDWCFFYEQRAETASIEHLGRSFRKTKSENGEALLLSEVRLGEQGYSNLLIRSQHMEDEALHVIARLRRRRPRARIPEGSFPAPIDCLLDMQSLAPVVIYAGSGLSYESNLPTLADIHNDFGVDDVSKNRLLFGFADPIPRALAQDAVRTISRFARFHLSAAASSPSLSHRRIAEFFERGAISTILTDNVDNLFARCGLPFIRTRTIFPERFEHHFSADARTLLVIGVAADRRQIIAQARKHGMRIVVVNPYQSVSPFAQNLSYLRKQDIWYRCTAREFFTQYCRPPKKISAPQGIVCNPE